MIPVVVGSTPIGHPKVDCTQSESMMKSIYHGTAGANAKLNGKQTKRLSCGCCVMTNFKWQTRLKEANTEIKRFSKE